jgi:hypothetical protein
MQMLMPPEYQIEIPPLTERVTSGALFVNADVVTNAISDLLMCAGLAFAQIAIFFRALQQK